MFRKFRCKKTIYDLSSIAIQNRKNYIIKYNSNNPTSTLNESVNLLIIFFSALKHSKVLLEEHKDKFLSPGFNRFINMMIDELNDDYFHQVKETLNNLKFKNVILIKSELGFGNKGVNYTLLKENNEKEKDKDKDKDKKPWLKRVFNFNNKTYSYDLGMNSGIFIILIQKLYSSYRNKSYQQ